MNELLAYLNAMPTAEQAAFAARCRTSVGYLRKAVSIGQRLSAEICIRIERESSQVVRFEVLRPDIDISWIRGQNTAQSLTHQSQEATETVAGATYE